MAPRDDMYPFAKVFSAKLEIYQKRESFVPRKFPPIRYLGIILIFHLSSSYDQSSMLYYL